MERLPKIGLPVLIIIFLVIIFISKSTVTIGSGEAGVLYKTFGGGVVTDQPALGEGFHLVAPWNKVIVYEVRQQSISDKMAVLSVNGLEIKVDGTVWFQPDPKNLGKLHQDGVERARVAVLQRLNRGI